jgi:DNA-binding transcriptional regulator LsrR (DeoR family)
VFRAYYLRRDGEPTYGEVAKEVGVKESDVRNYLTNCRGRLKDILRVRISDYAHGSEDVERELMRAMGR